MKRWAFNIFTGLSLLLGVMAAVLWVASARYCFYGKFQWHDEPSVWFTEPGRIALHWGVGDMVIWPWQIAQWNNCYVMREDFPAGIGTTFVGGLTTPKTEDIDEGGGRDISFPLGWIVAGTMLLPGIWLAGKLVKRRKRDGHCTKCGYDLRANKDRCPECGMAITNLGAST